MKRPLYPLRERPIRRRRIKVADPSDLVTVVSDSRDPDQDRNMTRGEAEKMFRSGKLDFDISTGCYCRPRRH